MSDNSVIVALEAGLQTNPDDPNLLLHLAGLYAETDGRQEGALTLVQRLLMLTPDNLQALELAVALARDLERDTLAQSYQRLLSSLHPNSSVSKGGSGATLSRIGRDGATRASDKDPHPPPSARQLRLVSGGKDTDVVVDIENSNIYLDDVGGMEDVKKRLRLSFLAPLQNPELMKAYGKSVRGGLLLYGPPGCGKTYIARALAGELGAKFVSIGITDILDMYIGESERKLHEIFEAARRQAPAVIFIDELDALGQKRSQLRTSGLRTLVNQLLTEMDSTEQNNVDLFVLAATNHPWDIDSALRRPGRFDRVVPVFPPDRQARESIISMHLKDKPTDSVDIAQLADQSHLYSGADLAHLCSTAVEFALEQSIESGEVRPINQQDLQKAVEGSRPTTLSWFESARNFAMFANENGIYDDLLEYISSNKL